MVAVTLQRGGADKPGPVLAQLVRSGQTRRAASLKLRAIDRADPAAGHMFVHLYTHDTPLGVGRTLVVLPASSTLQSGQ